MLESSKKTAKRGREKMKLCLARNYQNYFHIKTYINVSENVLYRSEMALLSFVGVLSNVTLGENLENEPKPLCY